MCGPFQSPGAWLCQGVGDNVLQGQGLISVNDDKMIEEDQIPF